MYIIFSFKDDDEKGPDCWICYDPDRNDCGPMIHPCDCRGDVGAVHHDCLRRWLVEVNIDWVKSGKTFSPSNVKKQFHSILEIGRFVVALLIF